MIRFLLGRTVHSALDHIVQRSLRGASASDEEPALVPWPEPGELGTLLRTAARDSLLEVGFDLPGLSEALARRATPYMSRARELLWADGPLRAVGAEVEGRLALGRQRVGFRADLIEAAKGERVLVDYKTGRPPSEAVREATRRRKLLSEIAEGRMLQAVAYRLASGRTRARTLRVPGTGCGARKRIDRSGPGRPRGRASVSSREFAGAQGDGSRRLLSAPHTARRQR